MHTFKPTSILFDVDFSGWSMSFLREMCRSADEGSSFALVNAVNKAGMWLGRQPTPMQWTTLWRHNFVSQGSLDVQHPAVEPFMPLLKVIYSYKPDILTNKDRRHLLLPPMRPGLRYYFDPTGVYKDESFDDWANDYLKRFFNNVVVVADNPELVDTRMWHELQRAAQYTHSIHMFQSFEEFHHILEEDISISNPDLQCFRMPLMALFRKRHSKFDRFGPYGGRRKGIVVDKRTTKVSLSDKRPLEDIELCPEEVLDVVISPIALEGKIGTPAFERQLIRILTYFLKHRRYRHISIKYLANFCKVDHRELEEWAVKCPRLVVKSSQIEGVQYLGLAPNLFLQWRSAAMKKKPSNNNGQVNTPSSLMADYGGQQWRQVSEDSDAWTQQPNALPETNADTPNTTKAQEVEVEDDAQATETVLDVTSSEFDAAATQFFSDGAIWRTLDALSTVTGHDKEMLVGWADSNSALIRRVSAKKPDVVYYALGSRLTEKVEEKPVEKVAENNTANGNDKKKNKKSKETQEADTTTVEKSKLESPVMTELMAFGMLHSTCDTLIRVMNFNANRLNARHPEAFAHLTQAQKHFSSGVALLQKGLKVSEKKLPPLEEI